MYEEIQMDWCQNTIMNIKATLVNLFSKDNSLQYSLQKWQEGGIHQKETTIQKGWPLFQTWQPKIKHQYSTAICHQSSKVEHTETIRHDKANSTSPIQTNRLIVMSSNLHQLMLFPFNWPVSQCWFIQTEIFLSTSISGMIIQDNMQATTISLEVSSGLNKCASGKNYPIAIYWAEEEKYSHPQMQIYGSNMLRPILVSCQIPPKNNIFSWTL